MCFQPIEISPLTDNPRLWLGRVLQPGPRRRLRIGMMLLIFLGLLGSLGGLLGLVQRYVVTPY